MNDENPFTCSYAAEALGNIGDFSAIPALTAALVNEKDDLRSKAAVELGKIGDVSAVPALIKMMKKENCWVREDAIQALGQIEDVSAVPTLLASLHNRDQKIRSEAARSLSKIGDKHSLPRKIFACKYLSAPNIIKTLEQLRHARYDTTIAEVRLEYDFPETRDLCEIVLQEEDELARFGAQSVLELLDR